MKACFKPLTYCIVFLLPLCLVGQTPYSQQYATEHGLPSMETYQVRLDSKGYLWVATDRGLSRFNGSEFVTFNQKDGLEDLTVFNIREDDQGRMWAATFSKSLFYFEGGRFHAFPHNDVLKKLIPYYLIDDMVITGDSIWISASRKGLLKMTMDGDWKWLSEGQVGTHFSQIGPNKHLFWTGPSHQPYSVEVSLGNGTQRYSLPAWAHKGLFSKTSILQLSNGDVIMAAFGGLFILHPDGHLTELPHRFYTTNAAAFEDQRGGVWIGSLDSGVRKFDLHQSYALLGHYLKDYSVTYIAGDPEGGIWMTTLEAGVQYIPSPEILNFQPGERKSNPKYIDLEVCQDRLFFSSNKGDLFEILQSEPELWDVQLVNDQKGRNGGNTIACFQDDFYFNAGGRIYRLNGSGFDDLGRELGFLIPNGDTLYAVNSRLYRYIPTIQLDTLEDFASTIMREGVMDAYQTIWLGRLNGTSYYKNGQLTNLDSLGPAFRSRVTDMVADELVLIATLGYGIICLEPQSMSFSFIDMDHGLPDNNTSAVYRQANGDVWVATAKGLCHLKANPEGEYQLVKTFTAQDGILRGEVQKIVEFKGMIWVLHQDGLSSIPVESQHLNLVPPHIQLVNAWVSGTETEPLLDEDELAYHQNDLAFAVEGIAYRNAFDLQYRYRLLGLDSAFRFTSDPLIQFNGLEPGPYTFEVQALNNDGLASQVPARLAFVIQAPYWLHTWFLLTITVLILVLIGSGIFLRDRIKNRRILLELEVLENEQKAVTAQINPHFIYNAMNSIQYFVLENEPEVAADYLAKCSQLMRMVLSNTQQRFIPLSDELTIIDLYLSLEKERFEDKFEYTVQVEPGLVRDQILIPSMVLQPHIENAIWHGLLQKHSGTRKLTIDLQSSGNNLVWEIKDNGVGRQASRLSNTQQLGHTSSGIELTRRRLELLNRQGKGKYRLDIVDLQDDHGAALGTLVRITLFKKLKPS